MAYFMQASGRLSVSSIYRELGEVMHELMRSMMIPGGLVFISVRSRDINSRKEKGRETLVWLVCKRIEVVNRAICGKSLRVLAPKVANISGYFVVVIMPPLNLWDHSVGIDRL